MIKRTWFVLAFMGILYSHGPLFAKEVDSTSVVTSQPATEAIKPSVDIEAPRKLGKTEKKLLEDRINLLREQKKKQFDEITDGFIKKIITEDSIRSKDDFLKPGARSLEEAIKRAIDVHVPAKTGQERIKLAKQRIVKAIRDLFAEATLELDDRGGTLSGQAYHGKSYHVRFRQPVFRGGQLWNTLEKEQATLRAAEAEYHQTVNDLIQKVSEAYFDSIRTAHVLKDKQELLGQANSALDMSKKKWEQGLISEIEYLNTESLQSQIAHDLEEARQEMELIHLELQKNLGLDIHEKVELVPFYDYETVINDAQKKSQEGRKEPLVPIADSEFQKPLDNYIEMAYENRPDLKLETNRLRANIMAKRVAAGKFFFPEVNVVMEFGELSEHFNEIRRDEVFTPEWQFVLEFTWNVLGNTVKFTHDRDQNAPSVSQFQAAAGSRTSRNGFSVSLLDNLEDMYRLKEAQVEIMDQFVKLEDKEREVIREVKEAYFNYRRAEIQLASETKQVLYRYRLAKLSKHKLDLNEIQTSEYLQSQMELVDKKARFHKAMSDFYVARAGLNRAVGIRDLLAIKKWDFEK